MSNTHIGAHPMIPRFIRLFSVPIFLGWIAIVVIVNTVSPQLEKVGEAHSVSLAPNDAPSLQAMQRIGKVFQEFDSNSSAMIVLEGDQPLGDAAHKYYDGLIDKLEADKKHVQHIQDFWGDPLTASGAQSADGKAAYVQVNLAGNQGESLSNESVQTVRDIVNNTPPPPGVKAYVTGPAPLTNDQHHAGDKSIKLITMITIAVISVMLLFVYRSIVTVLLVLVMMFIELAAARGIVAALGYYDLIGLSTFAVNLLTTLAIAASTDYAIFLLGRYHEARGNGEDRETAFYTMYHGTAHVILGSGLTIAGATFCLHFTRLPYFQTLGIPLAIGMLVAVAAALTMAPALLTICSRFGLFDPKRAMKTRGWRRVGTAVVRWPGPILAASVALALVGLLALPSYKPSYNDRLFLPSDIPANLGLRGRRPALPAGPDEPRDTAGRDRPRCAQLSGHVGHRPNRQGHLPHSRRRQGAGHHPAGGHSDRTHVDPVPDQHAGHHPADEPGLHGQSHGQHAQTGQRHADLHRHDGENAKHHHADGRDHAQHGPEDEEDVHRHRGSCGTTSRISTTSSGRCATTSTGNRTASTSPSAGRSGRSSTPSTASTR